MIDLTIRKAHPDFESYRIKFDGIDVGSIAYREGMGINHDNYWLWSVSTMPKIGGPTPTGQAYSFDEAKREFRAAFERWIATVPAETWAENQDYMAYVNRPERYGGE